MKKVFILICAAAMGLAACSNRNVQDTSAYYDANGKVITHAKDSSVYYDANGNLITDAKFKGAKYQIIDQEFDNTRAPESDYEAIPAYELQACGDSYLPPVDAKAIAADAGTAKGKAKAQGVAVSTKSTRAKKVTNTTNIYYVDGPNPNVPVSSTTTTKTVYTNGQVSSSTTSSSNAKTTVNPDGSVTTTTVNY